MGLFGLGKKKKEEETCNCCGGTCSSENSASDKSASDKSASMQETVTGIEVKILGGGCAKCSQLEASTIEALKELGLNTTIDHVKDFEKIASYGVMTTPALVLDNKVVSYGKVLKKDEVIKLLKEHRG